MATTAHYIVSDYNPEDREELEIETGQRNAEADIADPWLTEKAFGNTRRTGNAPKFIAATVKYDPWSEETPGAGPSRPSELRLEATQEPESVAGWYRTLARKTSSSTPTGGNGASRADTPAQPSVTQSVSRASKEEIKRDRNEWFISRALESQTRSAESSEISAPPTTSTLADILSRDPPPLPTEKPFTPPVWIALGPGNKGFEMLTKSGWMEGDALGKHTARRAGLGYRAKQQATDVEQTQPTLRVKRELEIVDVDATEIVDLTLSDDEYEDNVFIKPVSPPSSPDVHEDVHEDRNDSDMDHNPRALLTPLPTVLKSDKLGIGLKAKTIGPYRESVKRVTHSSAALAAHIRRGEELKRMKKVVGRGRRGHDRMKKRDEEKRRNLLAYLNAD